MPPEAGQARRSREAVSPDMSPKSKPIVVTGDRTAYASLLLDHGRVAVSIELRARTPAQSRALVEPAAELLARLRPRAAP